MSSGIFAGMSTLAEIEAAIEKLPPEQWTEIRRWMDEHAPRTSGPVDFARVLARSIGTATTGLSTADIMRMTRGED